MTQILVPTLGESVSEATVAQWLKKEGDTVAMDEPIVELETDKVTLEVNAPAAGVITKITVGEDENVEVGAILGEIGGESASVPAEAPANDPAPEATPTAPPPPAPEAAPAQSGPAARKAMADEGIDPASVTGTGVDGRVTKEDVAAHLAGAAPVAPPPVAAPPAPPAAPSTPAPSPAPSSAKPEREERVRMSRLRQSVAKRLKEAQNTAAMLTTFNEVDMGAVMAMRKSYQENFMKKHDVKLGFMSFFVKAAVQALKEFPSVNAEIQGNEMVYKNYYDIGVAVSTPQGLIVPVVRDCDDKSMAQIEKDIIDVGTRARDGKVGIEEMQGGTFTITNGGIFGSLLSTPILNTPQSGILGMHSIQQRPMAMPDGSVEVRPMMYLALSYDHRIIDGKEAVSFLVRIKQMLEDPSRLVLEV